MRNGHLALPTTTCKGVPDTWYWILALKSKYWTVLSLKRNSWQKRFYVYHDLVCKMHDC